MYCVDGLAIHPYTHYVRLKLELPILFGQIETNQIATNDSSDHVEHMQCNAIFSFLYTFGSRFMCLALCMLLTVHIELFANKIQLHLFNVRNARRVIVSVFAQFRA